MIAGWHFWLMGAGGGLSGLDLFEGPHDTDAHEAEQREPAEHINEGPQCGLAAQLLIEERLRGMESVCRADDAVEGVLGAA